MKTYRIHEGELDIPEAWKDQGMQVFRLPGGENGKDASIIITRDHDTTIAGPVEYSESQQEAVAKQFPGYRPVKQGELSIGGRSSACIEFKWRANGTVLRQRQAFLRADEGCMLTLTLTALDAEFDRHEDAWTQVTGSFRLAQADDLAADPARSPGLPPPSPHLVFVLHVRERLLKAHADAQQACAGTSSIDVEDQRVLFFAGDGTPLEPLLESSLRRSLLGRHEVPYHLRPASAPGAAGLRPMLDAVARYEGIPPLADLEALRRHLAPQASPAPGGSSGDRA